MSVAGPLEDRRYRLPDGGSDGFRAEVPEVAAEEESTRFRIGTPAEVLSTSGPSLRREREGAWSRNGEVAGAGLPAFGFQNGTRLPPGAGKFESRLFASVFSPAASPVPPLLQLLRPDGGVTQNALPVALGCDCFIEKHHSLVIC